MAILVISSVKAQEVLVSTISLETKDEKWLESVLDMFQNEGATFDVVRKTQIENQAVINLKLKSWPRLDLTREMVKAFVKRYGQGRVSISATPGQAFTTIVLHPTDTRMQFAHVTLYDDKTVEIAIYTHIEGT